MTTEKLRELRSSVRNISIQPPWCDNLDNLKKWMEGFETCQCNILFLIDELIKESANNSNMEAMKEE